MPLKSVAFFCYKWVGICRWGQGQGRLYLTWTKRHEGSRVTVQLLLCQSYNCLTGTCSDVVMNMLGELMLVGVTGFR